MAIKLPRKVSDWRMGEDFGRQVLAFAGDVYDALRAIKKALEEIDINGGVPAVHAASHLPSGSDPLETDAPEDITPGDTADEGSAEAFARADHVHGVPDFGTTAGTFCEGNDARLSDDRTASGLRTATTVVSVSAAAAPSSGQVLTATAGNAATWQTPASSTIGIWHPDVADTSATFYHAATSDEFSAGSIDAKWTENDPAGILTFSADSGRRMLKVDVAGVAGARWGFLYQPVPGSEFAAYTKVHNIQPLSNILVGIFVSEDMAAQPINADSRVVYTDYYNTAEISAGTRTNPDAQTAGAPTLLPHPTGWHNYLRIRCNGTTCASDASIDGVSWVQIASVTLAFTPVHFGVCAYADTSGAGVFLYDFFRVYEGAGSSAIDATRIGKLV